MRLKVLYAGDERDGPRSEEPPMLTRLGVRLKALRLARQWTLDQASERIGLSRSALSKIERDNASPTFTALQKIARGFGMDLTELLSSRPPNLPAGRRSITRAGEGQLQEMPNYLLRMLVTDLKRTAFIPYEAVLRARSLSEFDEWSRHDSEDFIYVLSGTMDFYTEFYEPVRLTRADSAYFDGGMGHACLSVGTEDAVLLCISAMRGAAS